ncbi:glycosyltransferase family 4 protein [Chryseobacterium salipaludis]|uniref:glycosyltransferase family 4 protein n=1 Tax=Chryseobacterium TaxID=59732 RepID=UPI002485BAD6|nr:MULTISPECIES: glycosyltransferase family 4 protein [Chryseobacterium]
MSKHFEVIGVSSPGLNLDLVKNREGCRVIAVEMQRNISPLNDVIALYKLFCILKVEKPVLVHSITPKAGLLTMLAARLSGVPIRVHTFTGLIFPTRQGFVRRLLILTDRILCWAATNIYPEGQGVKDDLQKFEITEKPLNVLANGNVNGIDTTYFSTTTIEEQSAAQLKAELGISSEDFIFIFVGRLVGDKGINELITAFSKISKSADQQISNSCKLLLVGPVEAKLDPLLPETLNHIEINPNIISVGFQQDVRPYFAIADALVFPSYREGFPNVVMQAGAMELPAIVTDINGCNEIIIHGKNGLIIPPKDSNALFNAMLQLWEDKTLYAQLKRNARPMITSRYEQQVVWDALLAEYNRLILEYKNKKGV